MKDCFEHQSRHLELEYLTNLLGYFSRSF